MGCLRVTDAVPVSGAGVGVALGVALAAGVVVATWARGAAAWGADAQPTAASKTVAVAAMPANDIFRLILIRDRPLL